MRRLPTGIGPLAIASLVVLYIPLVAVAALSFNASRYGTHWDGLTLSWYVKLLHNDAILTAAKNSTIVAVCSTTISTILGTLLAIGLRRLPLGRSGRTAADLVINLPTVTPDILLAGALVVSYGIFKTFLAHYGPSSTLFDPGLVTLTIGHITFQLSFVAVVVGARLKAIGNEQFEAARDLYAGSWNLWRRAILPQLAPGIVGGALLAFTLSLDDFVVSFFISGPSSETLPVFIYNSVRRGVTPEIHALSTLIVAATMLAIIGMSVLNRPRSPKE